MTYPNSKTYKIKDKYLAIIVYLIPILFLISAMSEKLSFLPSLIIVGSGAIFAIVFKRSELVKYHGIQSCIFNIVPSLLLFIISKIFISTNYLVDEVGFSVYMTIYTTLNLLMYFLPAYGIYCAFKCDDGNIPFLSKLFRKISSLI